MKHILQQVEKNEYGYRVVKLIVFMTQKDADHMSDLEACQFYTLDIYPDRGLLCCKKKSKAFKLEMKKLLSFKRFDKLLMYLHLNDYVYEYYISSYSREGI